MSLKKLLAAAARRREIDYLGFADLTPAVDFIHAQGGDVIAGFPFAVSIGIGLPNDIVDLLPQRAERAVQVAYRSQAYDVINFRLNLAASEIASVLSRHGRRAFPVPAAERVDDERIRASFSHKLAAHLAGLGWIGKSCLLVTPDRGPRVRWTTVLTDKAPDPIGRPMAERCGDCRACVEACPASAFTGRAFSCGEPRERRYDAAKCDKYFDGLQKQGALKVCGMCLHACPYGRRPGALRQSVNSG